MSFNKKKIIDVGERGRTSTFTVLGKGKGLQFFSDSDEPIGKETVAKDKSGKEFSVDNLQLVNKGKNLFMLSNDNKNKLFRSDTEYGKTLDELEYKFMRKDRDLPLNVVVPLHKFSQYEHNDNNIFHLAGLGGKDDKTIFSFTYDARDPHLVVKDDTSKEYASSQPMFTSIATSVDGYVVTGDAYGVVRIYNDTSKNAKYKLDQFAGVSSNEKLYPKGDPVIGIDISTNREWVVWTTPTFLAIVRFEDKESWEKGRTKKPHAMKLKVHPDHLTKYKIDKVEFLPAKFDVGPSQDLSKKEIFELYIFSYTGKHRVVWNMRKVAKDYEKEIESCYGTIDEVSGLVSDYAPEYGRPDSSVIALTDSVKHMKFEDE